MIKVKAGTVTAITSKDGTWHDVTVLVWLGVHCVSGTVSIADGRALGDSVECWVSPPLRQALDTLSEREQREALGEIEAIAAAAVSTGATTMAWMVEVTGDFGGSVGGWRPGITGSMNQTGSSDEEASTFESEAEAEDAARLVRAEGGEARVVRLG